MDKIESLFDVPALPAHWESPEGYRAGWNAAIEALAPASEVTDAVVERAAIAVFAADMGSDEAWPKATTREREFYTRMARAALQATQAPDVGRLVEKWRRLAEARSFRPGDTGPTRLQQCASELEAALEGATKPAEGEV
jgi:hypothetical protein